MATRLAVSLLAFAVLGVAGWYALDAGLAWLGLLGTVVPGGDAVRGAAAALLAVAGLWLTWRIVAMAVLGFFADAVEDRHYPAAAAGARELSLGEQARAGLGAAARALAVNLVVLPLALALLFTGLGTALLFLLVNAFLLGRELQDMVWLRHRRDGAEASPVSGFERFLLGSVIAALLMVPVVNLLAPMLGAASAAHLVNRKARR